MNHNEKIQELLNNSNNWNELKTKLEKFNTAQTDTTTKDTEAGKLFEHFAKAYFTVEPEQNQLYKNVWLFGEIPISIKEKLNFPHKDFGIDLLLQDNSDRVIAVQCKFKNNEQSILNWSKDKIGNAFGLAEKCDTVLVFTNASNIHAVAQTREKFKLISYSDLLNLKAEDFEAFRQYFQSHTKPAFKKLEPLEHQKEAISEVVKHFQTNDRGQLILPCGAGKTLTALWINEKLNAKNTLVLFPSLALLRQFKTEWSKNRSYDFDYICVCSEKDIDKSKEDTTVTHTYEISGEVTTNPNRVNSFLNSDKPKIIFSTYQSLEVTEEALKKNSSFDFDLIICDEAHRTAGSKTNNLFTLVHDNDRIRGNKRLYMTATPKVVSNNLKTRLGEDYELLCDMSNPDIFGSEAYRMSFGTAIQKDILVDYKIIGIGVTHKQVKEFIDQRRYITSKYSIDEIAHNYALDIVMDKNNASHSITFHHRVQLAKEFSERHKSCFSNTVYSQYVEGNQLTSYRASVLNEFKNNDKGVVSNARCLTEGVDVPTIDLIYFCDPKTSKIDIVQASGRALRKDWHGKKKMGYIVVPIFHHKDDDVEKEIEKKPYFQNLVSVIRSLCDQDERLQAEIDNVDFQKGQKIFKRIEVTYNDEEIEKIIKLDGLEKRVREFLFEQIIEKTRNYWNVKFQQLKEYIEKFGHSTISKGNLEYRDLYYWIGNLRKSYHEGKLDKEKLKRLNEIGFNWKGEQRLNYLPPDQKWKKNYEKLKKYFEEHGNSDIPARYKKDKSLATWCVGQRVKYDNGKLSEEQIDLLEQLKFKWEPKNNFMPRFIQELKIYKDKHGNVNVKTQSKEYPKLGRWVNKVRMIYKHGKRDANGNVLNKGRGRILKNEIIELNEMGFIWDAGHLDWDERYDKLTEYYLKNGHSNVPQSENIGLYFWCYKQRKRKSSLTEDEIEKLNKLEFNFELQQRDDRDEEEIFLENIVELKKYYDENETFIIKQNDKENYKLKYWVSKIRKAYFNNQLSQQEIDLLKDIGYNIEEIKTDEQNWNEKYEQLKKYFNEHKVFVFPNTPEYRFIRAWLQYQRKLNRKGELLQTRKKLLEDLGYSFDQNYQGIHKTRGSKEQTWERWITELKNYYSEKGTFKISNTDKENQSLLNWLRTTRQLYRNGTLEDEKVQQLKEMGYDFDKTFRGVVKDKITKQWLNMLNELKRYYEKNGTFYLTTTILEQKKLCLWVRTQKTFFNSGKLSDERQRLLSQIGFSLTTNYFQPKGTAKRKSHQESWNEKLEWLKEYYANNKTFYISRMDLEHKDLLIWLQVQRLYFRQGKLSEDRLNKLKEIGYSFDIKYTGKTRKPKEKKIKEKKQSVTYWDEQYLKLLNYKMQNGNCNVPRSYSDRTLAFWVTRQRTLKRKGKLSNDEINKLDLLGFDWKSPKLLSDFEVWNKTFQKLKVFYEQHGHTSPIKKDGDKQLVIWVIQQRHRKRKGDLKPDYEKLLNELKFDWNPEIHGKGSKPDDEVWLQRLNELIAYKNKFGDTNVSQLNKEYYSLSRWVNDQRQHKKKGKLSQFRIDKLSELNFIWDAKTIKNDEIFNQRFDELVEFKKIYGHLKVPQKCKEFPKLGTWLSQIKHRGTTEERMKRLNEIGLYLETKDAEKTLSTDI